MPFITANSDEIIFMLMFIELALVIIFMCSPDKYFHVNICRVYLDDYCHVYISEFVLMYLFM